MKMQKPIRISVQITLVLISIIFMAIPSFAAVFNLRAAVTTLTMPDGETILVGGFALGGGPVKVPGPFLEVPPGDNTLTINLTNNLSIPVSIVIPGQLAALSPSTFTDAQGRQRVNSFTTVTPAGATNTYTWNNLKPGTYIYHSGTFVAFEVHMGLYGGVKKDASPGEAYPGISYDNEVILFYSEIDPALHNLPTPAQPLNYKPKYFLINGQPYPDAIPVLDHPITGGEQVLIRFLNMGFKSHVPTFNDQYVSIIAEDGNLLPYPKNQYSVLLPAGKTMDVLWTVPVIMEGSYPVYDRMLFLTNKDASPGGMLVYLQGSFPSITVTVPAGGESWAAGTMHAITWTYTGDLGSFVRINLLKGGVVVNGINSPIGTGGTGSFNWTIPISQTLGSDYQIRVTSIANPAVSFTTPTFTVTAPLTSTITVTSPAGGEIWNVGTTHAITWTYTGDPGSFVRINLLKGGVVVNGINSPIGTGGTGSFNWTIPISQTLGSDYQIRVTSIFNPTVTDTSNLFTIAAP